jgi:hypothetical protein
MVGSSRGIERKALFARAAAFHACALKKIACSDGELERGIVHQTRLERRAMR